LSYINSSHVFYRVRPLSESWGAGMVICLELGADLHIAHLMPLPLTVSCFSKIQIGFTFLITAHPGSPGQRAVKWVCACVCVCVCFIINLVHIYLKKTLMFYTLLVFYTINVFDELKFV